MGHGQVLHKDFKVHKMTVTNNDQMAGGTDLPASGAYIDVSPYERFHITARLGVVHNSDAPVIEPKAADAIGGTLDSFDSDGAHTVDAADDTEYIEWTIETRKLPTDHHFISLDVSGTVSNGSFLSATLRGEGESKPVTQTTAVLPTTSQYIYAG